MRCLRMLTALVFASSILLALTVTTPHSALAGDVVVSGADCDFEGLSDAIDAAETDDPDNPGLVTFDCTSTIISFDSQIDIEGAVTIDGSNNGNPIIFDGQHETRFFELGDPISSGYLTLQHLTLRNGSSFNGGAVTIYEGSLTISHSTFIGNTALNRGGAIYSRDPLTITDSRFEDNISQGDGGAIYHAESTTTIMRTSFVNNQATNGGAIAVDRFDVNILASTFTGNQATALGSSVYVAGDLIEDFTDVLIAWSTIIQPDGETSPAFSNNGLLTLQEVIIGGFGDNHCENISNALTIPLRILRNVDGDCATGYPAQDLLLGPLSTTTIDGVVQSFYPLLEGSPAIDAGPDFSLPAYACDTSIQGASPDTDQLGNPRPANATDCDLGAIEGFILYSATLCANPWNGSLRFSDNCSRSETQITLPQDSPLQLCVNSWNGDTRSSTDCSRSEYPLTVESRHTIPICINNWNNTIRVSDNCTRSEDPDLL